MLLEQLNLRVLLAGVVTVCAVSSAAASTKPYCEDSSFKLGLIAVAVVSQWLVAGFATGFAARVNGLYQGLLLGFFGSLLTSALWVLIVWGRHAFSLQLYWFTLSTFILYAVPLAAIAGYCGSAIRKRLGARERSTTEHLIVF